MECRHVNRLSFFDRGGKHSVFSPENWTCGSCNTTESVWACLSCSNVACGRYISEHALKHFENSQHPLSIEVNDLFVFCYICDDYVLNDNPAGDLRIIRSILSSLHLQSFDVCETRSGRILRSLQPSITDILARNEKIRKEDRSLNALHQRRLSLLRRTFCTWKERSTSSAAQESRRTRRVTLASTADLTSSDRGKHTSGKAQRRSTKRRFSESVSASSEKRPKLSKLTPGVLGLRNLGNTCYLNSILQVLGHLLPFTKFFLELNLSGYSPASSPIVASKCGFGAKRISKRLSTHECFDKISRKSEPPPLSSSPTSAHHGLEGGSSARNGAVPAASFGDATVLSLGEVSDTVMLSEEVHALLRVMWAGKHHLVAPFGLLHSVWRTIPALKGHSQQDAQEFLRMLLSRIEGELLEHVPESHSILQGIFYGELHSQVKCLKCDAVNHLREPFSDLPLDFPDRFQSERVSKMDTCNLYEMLAQFTDTEPLGCVYSCTNCKQHQPRLRRKSAVLSDAEKRLTISSLPVILTIHFKRFRWISRNGREKITALVKFPLRLDLSPFISEKLQLDSGGAEFALRGVVKHHGSGFTSGHYTAYCWNSTGQFWVHFNDAKSERCTEEEVLNSQAYILFYVRQVPHCPKDLPVPSSPESLIRYPQFDSHHNIFDILSRS